MRLVFDIEANGFLENVSQVWCLVTKDLDTSEVRKFEPFQVEQGLRHLMQAKVVIGHNIIGYDLPVLEKLYPWFHIPWSKVIDTLVLSRLVFSNLSDTDMSRRAVCEAKMIGSHSLKAWGIRLGLLKLEHEDWTQFSPEMLERCAVDVDVTERLWKLIEAKNVDPRANELEHSVAIIVARQERQGYSFDVQKAETLTATLMMRRTELEAELQDTFKPFYLADGPVKVWKRTINRKKGDIIEYCPEGGEYQPIKLTIFNPGSRHHIANRLKCLYNWKPEEFTESGQPKVDESVLGKLPWSEAKLLNEYMLVQKRLGMLAEGDNAWLKLVRNGKLHGEVITNGAVTGRATHRNPNIAQVPAVSALYGKECRELFRAERGKVQVGIDVSGLELRMLAHYLSRWDDGAYGRVVCEGDVHTVNQEAAGLETRSLAKTFIYAFLYGAGDWKIGHTVQPLAHEDEKKVIGKALKERFTKRTPGLEKLLDAVKAAAKRGYLVGLDGRHLHIRSDHAALNTLLQSAGALVCKRWMVEIDLELARRDWHGKVQQLAFVHDELQFQANPDVAEDFGKLAVDCIKRAADYFRIQVPLTGEYKIGNNWAECH